MVLKVVLATCGRENASWRHDCFWKENYTYSRNWFHEIHSSRVRFLSSFLMRTTSSTVTLKVFSFPDVYFDSWRKKLLQSFLNNPDHPSYFCNVMNALVCDNMNRGFRVCRCEECKDSDVYAAVVAAPGVWHPAYPSPLVGHCICWTDKHILGENILLTPTEPCF